MNPPKPRAEKRTYADRAEYNRAYQRYYRRRQPRPATLMERVARLEAIIEAMTRDGPHRVRFTETGVEVTNAPAALTEGE
jgi:hypothetical protein